MSNYNEKYAQITAELRKAIRLRKSNDMVRFAYAGSVNLAVDPADRAERIRLIDAITADYMAEHSEYVSAGLAKWERDGAKGERPKTTPVNSAILESLADAILDEELTDMNEHKVSQTEHPFLSDTQILRRDRREPIGMSTDTYGADSANYRKPIPRERSDYELEYVDKESKRVNRARSAQYRKDTTASRVHTYNLRDTDGEFAQEFTQCHGISGVWRGYVDQAEEIAECDR